MSASDDSDEAKSAADALEETLFYGDAERIPCLMILWKTGKMKRMIGRRSEPEAQASGTHAQF